ncbi:YicC/YloC family endoribonuclease [Desulfospira joergensenii]|uniref:YicC/YloC family endoribonuclease n=1 Tax=Desulfospira joergensenii TaxID=53329 RepID=UPI0003B70A65|nr:YicC/YloC family endoribonuclease [Desulfospira joergensenii]
MIKSMTAFAKASESSGHITADATIRSYNSRFLDFALHLPEICQPFEEEIKKIISGLHQRGRIEVRINIEDDSTEPDLYQADMVRAESYFRVLTQIREHLQLESGPTLDQVLSARNLIQPAKKEIDAALLWEAVSGAVESASADLDRMRCREGENLYKDLAGRMDFIEKSLAGVETLAKEIPKIYRKRLMERLDRITADINSRDSVQIDPVRLAQEAAILADKSDVSEEIVRLHSHIKQFREVMDSGDSQGRKLNFLIQEFNREFNTIGSKAGHADLSHRVVDLKSELEKIREQVQNIE